MEPCARQSNKGSIPGFLIVLFALLAYLPALEAGFIWDDDWYITGNPLLRDFAGLARIWIPGQTVQYYPAVFTTFWIEHALWGLDPAGYHAVNVLLHALNAWLLWQLLQKLAVPGAWLGAVLFALHPVHVESVAWIAERKNVLSGMFYLLAAVAWLRFQARDEASGSAQSSPASRTWSWYGLTLGLFVAALLSKSVTCSLPAALILVMLWQRKPVVARTFALLAPMFLVGLAFALHTAWIERAHVGAEGVEFDFTLAERLLIASRALVFYPLKLLWPWPLSFIYPRWELQPERWTSWLPLALSAFTAGVLLYHYKRGLRGPALAAAFYAGTIFPALGFFNIYPMRYSFVADHFQYLASLGVILLVAACVTKLASNRPAAQLAVAAVLAGLGYATWRQTTMYANAETLWRTTLERNPGAWMAHSNLAQLLSDRGDNSEALEHLDRALELGPSQRAEDQIRLNRALALGKLGRDHEALKELRTLQESAGGQELRLARTLERLGRDVEADTHYRAALERGTQPEALPAYAAHLLRLGRSREAVALLEPHTARRPEDLDAWMFLSDAQAGEGRVTEAIASAERALSIARSRGDGRVVALIEQRLTGLRVGGDAPLNGKHR